MDEKKIGNKTGEGEHTLLEANFLGRKFWGASFGANSFGNKFWGRKFGEQNFWDEFWREKNSFWEEKNTGEQKSFILDWADTIFILKL